MGDNDARIPARIYIPDPPAKYQLVFPNTGIKVKKIESE